MVKGRLRLFTRVNQKLEFGMTSFYSGIPFPGTQTLSRSRERATQPGFTFLGIEYAM